MIPEKTPAPTRYDLGEHETSSLKKRAPKYSFGLRPNINNDGSKTPGPAYVNIDKLSRYGKPTSLANTMHARFKERKIDYGTNNTGHQVVDVSLYKQKPPMYSMGMKTKLVVNNYTQLADMKTISTDIYKQKAPEYSMFRRYKDATRPQIPAPNQFEDAVMQSSLRKTKKHNPQYFIGQTLTFDATAKKYKPPMQDISKHNPFSVAPSYSMRRKLTDYGSFGLTLAHDNC